MDRAEGDALPLDGAETQRRVCVLPSMNVRHLWGGGQNANILRKYFFTLVLTKRR